MNRLNQFTKRDLEVIEFDDFDGLIVGTPTDLGYYATASFKTVKHDDEDDVEMNANADLFMRAQHVSRDIASKGYIAMDVIGVVADMIDMINNKSISADESIELLRGLIKSCEW